MKPSDTPPLTWHARDRHAAELVVAKSLAEDWFDGGDSKLLALARDRVVDIAPPDFWEGVYREVRTAEREGLKVSHRKQLRTLLTFAKTQRESWRAAQALTAAAHAARAHGLDVDDIIAAARKASP